VVRNLTETMDYELRSREAAVKQRVMDAVRQDPELGPMLDS
jgi:hypothetical protein